FSTTTILVQTPHSCYSTLRLATRLGLRLFWTIRSLFLALLIQHTPCNRYFCPPRHLWLAAHRFLSTLLKLFEFVLCYVLVCARPYKARKFPHLHCSQGIREAFVF
ncbi:hypothetical protein K438DRAFT_2027739, partial [Mycena galopus ATCC 62051]